MVFLKLLAIIDFCALLCLLFAPFLPARFILTSAGLLLLKGGFFTMLGSFISVLDILVAGILFFLMLDVSHPVIIIVAAVFLGQKIIVSFL